MYFHTKIYNMNYVEGKGMSDHIFLLNLFSHFASVRDDYKVLQSQHF
jgi:hypothetical protein